MFDRRSSRPNRLSADVGRACTLFVKIHIIVKPGGRVSSVSLDFKLGPNSSRGNESHWQDVRPRDFEALGALGFERSMW